MQQNKDEKKFVSHRDLTIFIRNKLLCVCVCVCVCFCLQISIGDFFFFFLFANDEMIKWESLL